MTILAIDPSFSGCGVVTLDDNNVREYFLIKTDKSSRNSIDITHRIIEVKSEVKKIIKKYNPEYIALEGPSYASQSSSVLQMGALNHILRELFIEENIKFIIVPPTVIKKFFTGKGNCDKFGIITECMTRGADIPFFKTIKKVKTFDDNCADAYALSCFLDDYLKGRCTEYEQKIEKSWIL